VEHLIQIDYCTNCRTRLFAPCLLCSHVRAHVFNFMKKKFWSCRIFINEGEGVTIKYGLMIFGGNFKLEYLDSCSLHWCRGLCIPLSGHDGGVLNLKYAAREELKVHTLHSDW